jgi:hypothetical protein
MHELMGKMTAKSEAEKSDWRNKMLYKAVIIGLVRGNVSTKAYEKTSAEGKTHITEVANATGASTGVTTRGHDTITFGRIVSAFPSIAMKVINGKLVSPREYSYQDIHSDIVPPALAFPGAIGAIPKADTPHFTEAFCLFHYCFRNTTSPRARITPKTAATEVSTMCLSKVSKLNRAQMVEFGLLIAPATVGAEYTIPDTVTKAATAWKTFLKSKRSKGTPATTDEEES